MTTSPESPVTCCRILRKLEDVTVKCNNQYTETETIEQIQFYRVICLYSEFYTFKPIIEQQTALLLSMFNAMPKAAAASVFTSEYHQSGALGSAWKRRNEDNQCN